MFYLTITSPTHGRISVFLDGCPVMENRIDEVLLCHLDV